MVIGRGGGGGGSGGGGGRDGATDRAVQRAGSVHLLPSLWRRDAAAALLEHGLARLPPAEDEEWLGLRHSAAHAYARCADAP